MRTAPKPGANSTRCGRRAGKGLTFSPVPPSSAAISPKSPRSSGEVSLQRQEIFSQQRFPQIKDQRMPVTRSCAADPSCRDQKTVGRQAAHGGWEAVERTPQRWGASSPGRLGRERARPLARPCWQNMCSRNRRPCRSITSPVCRRLGQLLRAQDNPGKTPPSTVPISTGILYPLFRAGNTRF